MKHNEISVNEAKEKIKIVLEKNLVPFLWGSPGIGKSELIAQIAENLNLEIIILPLSQCEPTDLMGIPELGKHKCKYVPMDMFPLQNDPLPEGKDGWLLFVDEFNHADTAVIKAAYRLVLDKTVGMNKLHDNCRVVAAGNKDSDNAFTEDMGSAMSSRFIHLELAVHPEQWVDWALNNKIDMRIINFIQYMPNHLHNFDPDNQVSKTFACPRTWVFLSKLISDLQNTKLDEITSLIIGSVGEGVGREFQQFIKIYSRLAKFEEILADPITAKLPESPAESYGSIGMLGTKITVENCGTVIKFIQRMPLDFQILIVKNINKINPEVYKSPKLSEWKSNVVREIG